MGETKAHDYKMTDKEATDWEQPGADRDYPARAAIKAKAEAAAKKAGAGIVQMHRPSGFLVDAWSF